MHSTTHTRTVLVTGASEGIGAEVALRFASPDTHVLVNYRTDAAGANAVVDTIERAGGHATAIVGDVADHADTAAMMDTIATLFGRLDAVVLNASGDVEAGTDAGAAIGRYRDAHRRLAQLAIPLMPVDGHIVFVTNDQAHFFPHKAVPKGLVALAAGQRASETALYSLRSEFHRAGIRFTVVTGTMFDGDLDEAVLGRRAAAVVTAASAALPASIVFVGTDVPVAA